MTPETYDTSDMLRIALNGETFGPVRVIATYADPSNWVQLYGGETSDGNKALPCEWAFVGPTRPGYELAQHALRNCGT